MRLRLTVLMNSLQGQRVANRHHRTHGSRLLYLFPGFIRFRKRTSSVRSVQGDSFQSLCVTERATVYFGTVIQLEFASFFLRRAEMAGAP